MRATKPKKVPGRRLIGGIGRKGVTITCRQAAFLHMPRSYPTETRALCLAKAEHGPFFYDAVIKTLPLPALKSGEVLVRMGAAAFNHKDVRAYNSALEYPSIKTPCVKSGYLIALAA